eukprot:gene6116-6355_t
MNITTPHDSFQEAVSSDSVLHMFGLTQILVGLVLAFPVWLFGLLIGLLLPRRSSLHSSLDYTSENASFGISSRPLADEDVTAAEADEEPAATAHVQLQHGSKGGWYITEADLQKFQKELQQVDGKLLSGHPGPEWTQLMDKDVLGELRYVSFMRPTENGATDYLSVTIIPDATAQEIMEFCGDDACRARWDPMLASTWLLGSRDTSACEQLVVWLRSFPMGFLSDRLYAAIARKAFVDPHHPRSVLYAVSKVVKTPIATAWAAEHYPGVIQTDNYYSAWRCRTIPSPWPAYGDSPSPPACELVLFHHDELKVPEYLARMAIKVGMWRFVRSMVDAAGVWLEQRRSARCIDPFHDDPQAACRQTAPPLSGAAAEAAAAAHAGTQASKSPFSDSSGAAAALAPAGAEDVNDDQVPQSLAEEVMSPRWLHAVPTAPDLHALALAADEAAGVTKSRASSPTATFAAGRRRHHRAHSLDWEPRGSLESMSHPHQDTKHNDKSSFATSFASSTGVLDGVNRTLHNVAAGASSSFGAVIGVLRSLPGTAGKQARAVLNSKFGTKGRSASSACVSGGTQVTCSCAPGQVSSAAAKDPQAGEAVPRHQEDDVLGTSDQAVLRQGAAVAGTAFAPVSNAGSSRAARLQEQKRMAAADRSDGKAVKKVLLRGGLVMAAVCMAGLLTHRRFGRHSKEAVVKHASRRKQRG